MSRHSGEDEMAMMHVAHIEIPGPIIGGVVKYSCIQDLPDAVLHTRMSSLINSSWQHHKVLNDPAPAASGINHSCSSLLVQPQI